MLVAAPHGDLASLQRAAAKARARGIDFILDPMLDPIHFGFTASLARYVELRRREPEAEILMGTGNLTELTDADTSGVTAMLLGICSELAIRNLLVVQVSPHTRRTVEEHDAARRIMFAARGRSRAAQGLCRRAAAGARQAPFRRDARGDRRARARLRDANFRIEVAEDGIHVFARGFHRVATDAMSLFPVARCREGRRARLLSRRRTDEGGDRLAARQALRQDEPLDFGAACDEAPRTKRASRIGHTLRKAEGTCTIPMIRECVVTTCPPPARCISRRSG